MRKALISWRFAVLVEFAAMESESRFAQYIESLTGVLGHADRAEPLKDYCTGLLMPVERKSVEPMAAMVSPGRAVPRIFACRSAVSFRFFSGKI